MSIRLKGEFVEWIKNGAHLTPVKGIKPNIDFYDPDMETVIELPNPKPKVGDVVLVRMKIARPLHQGMFMAEDSRREIAICPEDIVAVLPSEAKPTEPVKEIEPMDTNAGYLDIHMRIKINEIIEAVNKLSKEGER